MDNRAIELYDLNDSMIVMAERMTSTVLETALRRLGALVSYHRDIEILLVGGAAGMMTGVLPGARTTTDCDVMVYMPEDALAAVESAAGRVAEELGLADRWLNSDAQIRRDVLPDGWERRKVMVGVFGILHVDAASRPDLIAMKVLAGRTQDLEDLASLRPRQDELDFVAMYLAGLESKGTSREQIEDARLVLSTLEAHDED